MVVMVMAHPTCNILAAVLSVIAFSGVVARAAEWPRIVDVALGKPIVYANSNGDVWQAAWADNGELYSCSDDTSGFNNACHSNFAYHKISGDDPARLVGDTINPMRDYGNAGAGGKDGCTWKADGNLSLDGVLYLWISRHRYGWLSHDPQKRQFASNASLIKSTDHGKTWVRSAKENYEQPMFPGRRFGAPFFVLYGKDGKADTHGANKYVYAVSNDGFWDNGNDMILARVPRSKIGDLRAADWEFFSKGDGLKDGAWSKKMGNALPIIRDEGKCSMTGAAYLPRLHRYLMIQWYYTSGSGTAGSTKTVWNFYQSPTPWGPWAKFKSWTNAPSGYYNPCVVSKFNRAGDKELTVFTAGDYKNQKVYYKLTVIPCTLSLGESP